jgi:glycosyltransferase involved in cell wall biosynthesis
VQVCTIVARNYLAHARVLVASYLRHHPGARASVLLVDGRADEGLTDDDRFETVYAEQLGIEPRDLRRMLMVYDVTELSTALKPSFLQYLLAGDGGSPVLYLDPDCLVFRSLDRIADLATAHSLVLTPHVMSPIPRDGLLIDERTLLWSGMFNLGFVCVSADARPFLEWWHERTMFDAVSDPREGLFTDQRWIDFVPSLFPHVVLRDRGCNVAYWNLFERPIERLQDGTITAGGAPLAFFHFSGYDADRPQTLSKHQGEHPRAQLSNEPVVRELTDAYAAALRTAGFDRLKEVPYRYSSLAGGPVPVEVRRVARAALLDPDDGAGEPPDPFGDDGGEAFLDWLNEPVISIRGTTVSRLLVGIWRLRVDLQAQFPVIEGPDAVAFARWAAIDDEFQRRYGHLYRPGGVRPTAPFRRQPSPGLNVVGYFDAEMGVGEAGRLMVRAAERAGLPIATQVYRRTASRRSAEFALPDRTGAPYDVSVLCANADCTPRLAAQLDASRATDRHRVGLWFWEVADFPRTMHAALDCVDEVWVASGFVRDAIQPHTARPVTVFPLPIVTEPPTFLTRADLDLPDGFLFAFCYDRFSVVGRKNPVAVVEAFTTAFPRPGEAVLVMKSINATSDLATLDRLDAAVGGRPDIFLLDGYWPRSHVNALIQLCDCYVSLHRSEGFGLTLGAAMAQGKPVVATGYSGNLAFMDATNSLLVPYELVTVGPGHDPYSPGALWADPDVDAAAALMRRVYDEPGWAADLGERGRESVARTHGIEHGAAALLEGFDRIHHSLWDVASRPEPANGAGPGGRWWQSIRGSRPRVRRSPLASTSRS